MHLVSALRRLACTGMACSAVLAGAAPARAAAPIALGVNLAGAPGELAPIQSYAALTGRAPAIVMWYQQWSEPLTWSTQLPNVEAAGALPMVTWDPMLNGAGIPLARIAAGDYDSYIKASADAAAAWKLPILIRFAHEMNLPGSPYGPGQDGNTPADFVAAWRHVVSIFREEHATNVEWVWSPNADCGGKCPFTAFYPGDSWVDWVALDGYNYAAVDRVPWMTFAQIFGSSYAELTQLTSKPIIIAETASTELGGNKAQWITQTFATLPQQFPQVRAVVWFDRVKETDWTVNSSPASLAAWQAVESSAAYTGTPASLIAQVPTGSDVDSVAPGGIPTLGAPLGTPPTANPPSAPAGAPPAPAGAPPAPAGAPPAPAGPPAPAADPSSQPSPPAGNPASTTPAARPKPPPARPASLRSPAAGRPAAAIRARVTDRHLRRPRRLG